MGYSGLASNLAGIQWLANMIGHFGYEVVPVRLHPHILHLDCALSLLREGLMIVCEEAFLDGLPAQLANWEKIEAKGIKVEAIDYHVSRMLGGSFRCTTQALIRE